MSRGIALVLLATLFWGTSGTSSTFAPADAGPLSIGAARLIIGALGLLAIALARGGTGPRRDWPWLLTILGAAGIAGGQVAFFEAIHRTGVAVSTVLTIGVAPVFAGLLGAWLLRERPNRMWGVATLLAVAGAALMVLGTAEAVGGDPIGSILAVFSGFGYGVYVTSCKKMMLRGQDAVDITAFVFCGAALALLPIFLLGDWQWVLEPRGAIVALYLGLATNAIPYVLLGLGLALVPVATVATLTLMEPLTATLLGVVLLGERLSLLQWCGAFLLLLGLIVLAMPKRRRSAALHPA